MKMYLELRACTGGDEAQNFARELLTVYLKYARKNNLKSEIISEGKTITVLIEGKESIISPLLTEDGVHKVQRMSKGKLHTSTVSVAVLPVSTHKKIQIKDTELKFDAYRGSGNGGQHRNTTDSAIRLTHIPTGIVVYCENERSQHQNKALAREILESKLQEIQRQKELKIQNNNRHKQVGMGDRAESRRTYNYIRGEVVDNRTNKTCALKEIINKANLMAIK